MSPGLVIIGICTIGRVCLWLNELVLAANDVPDTRTRNNAAGEKGEGEKIRFNHHGKGK